MRLDLQEPWPVPPRSYRTPKQTGIVAWSLERCRLGLWIGEGLWPPADFGVLERKRNGGDGRCSGPDKLKYSARSGDLTRYPDIAGRIDRDTFSASDACVGESQGGETRGRRNHRRQDGSDGGGGTGTDKLRSEEGRVGKEGRA